MFGVDQYLMAAAGLFVIAAPVVMYADSCGRRWLLLACTVIWALLGLLTYVIFGREIASGTAAEITISVIVNALPAAAVGIVVRATTVSQWPGLVRSALVVVAGVVGLLLSFFVELSLVCGLTGNCL